MAGVHDGAARVARFLQASSANQKSRHLFNRFLCRRQTDALQRPFHQGLQPFHAQRQVRTAPVADHGMDLIHNQRAHRRQHIPAGLRSQQQIERLRRGHENVRRFFGNGLPLRRRRVAGADFRPHFNVAPFARSHGGPNARQRFLQILVNVVAESFERRDINHARLVPQLSSQPFAKQLVERREECRQGFARTGRRGDQGVRARLNRRPAAFLWFGRRSEFPLEPPRYHWMKLEPLHECAS